MHDFFQGFVTVAARFTQLVQIETNTPLGLIERILSQIDETIT